MHEVDVKGILSAKNGMNIYRGCTHGCIYCDSRSKCYQINHDFEDIEVKSNAPILLEDALRRKKEMHDGTGGKSDLYSSGKSAPEVPVIEDMAGLLQTKSARILRDWFSRK